MTRSDRDMHIFFTVVVVATENTAHLIPFTLDSIAMQVFPSFEIVIVNGQSQGSSLETFQMYHTHIHRIYDAMDRRLYSMMNKGVSLARGEYVHFLMPGEFYITRHAFSFMLSYIQTQEYPDFVQTGSVVRHSLSEPQLIIKEMTKEDLKGGKISSSLQAFWFKKKTLVDCGGFCPDFRVQGGYDLVCRLYLEKGIRKAFMRRMLTDYEYRRAPSKKIIQQFAETLFIIWKHFGINKALLWWVAQNPWRLMHWWLKSIQGALWKQDKTF